jgi:Uri superfamily endonuclease
MFTTLAILFFLLSQKPTGLNGINIYSSVYPAIGKPQMEWAKNKSGVYFIKENGRLVYIGHSGYNLYKTITRHFQQWDQRQYRVTYIPGAAKYQVKAILTSPAEAPTLEEKLINQYKPRDNKNQVNIEYEVNYTPEDLEILQTEKTAPF